MAGRLKELIQLVRAVDVNAQRCGGTCHIQDKLQGFRMIKCSKKKKVPVEDSSKKGILYHSKESGLHPLRDEVQPEDFESHE